MAMFSICPKQMYIQLDKLKRAETTFRDFISEVENVRSNTLHMEFGSNNIVNDLHRIIDKQTLLHDNLVCMRKGLESAVNEYVKTEQQLLEKEPKTSIAWKSGSIKKSGKVLGISTAGELSGELFGASYNTKAGAKVSYKYDEDTNKYKFDTVGAEWSVKGEAHAAKGSASGNFGLLSGSVTGSVGCVSGTLAAGGSLYKNGKLSPQIYAKASAEAAAAKGKADAKFGSDNNNLHTGAEGSLLEAKAKAEAAAGVVSYENKKTGNKVSGIGVKGEVNAEAYAAEGSVSGGVKIMGIQFDVSLSGKAGGAGVSAGGAVTTGGCSGGISAGVLLGAGVDFSIDWSHFKFGW